jgi:hypothetical protein
MVSVSAREAHEAAAAELVDVLCDVADSGTCALHARSGIAVCRLCGQHSDAVTDDPISIAPRRFRHFAGAADRQGAGLKSWISAFLVYGIPYFPRRELSLTAEMVSTVLILIGSAAAHRRRTGRLLPGIY